MYIKPTAPRSIGGVLDDSIRLYREGFAKTWPLALGAQALIAVPTLYMRLKMAGVTTTGPQAMQAMLAMYATPSFWAPYLVAVLAGIGFYNGITLQLSALFHGRVVSAGESLAGGYRLLPRVILLFLLYAVCAGIIGVVFYLAPFAARALLSIVALPVAIFLLGRVYLSSIALVADDLGVFRSVETSWSLTRGNWWRGATIYTVIILIVMVFYFVIGLATGLFAALFGPKSATGIGAGELVSLLGNSVVLPLVSATVLGIYNDFKLRTEGADLADRVNALAPQ